MPVKIYWGPPGSYKTASAVWDDVTECAKQGRVLITNVRGLTEAKCAEHLKVINPGFRVMHFAMDRPSEMGALRRWWHWAPFGAYFVLDEVQVIYPPFWKPTQMRELDGPGDRDRKWPSGEVMPKEMETAFDMHRHGNWDFTFTTPNIKKVRPEIRAAAEWAYKHRNLAYIGFLKGSYMEFQHNAEDNGNPSDIFTARRRKVPPHVFQLYHSTATGTARDSAAGGSIFTSPYFLLLAAGIAALLVFVGTRPAPAALQAAYGSGPPPVAGLSQGAGGGAVPAHPQGLRQPGAPLSDPTFRLEPGHGYTPQAVAAPVPAPTGPQPSNRWRLLGVLTMKGKPGFAVLANGAARRRVVATTCELVDQVNEWECVIDGELITRWTGADPLSETIGTAKPTQS